MRHRRCVSFWEYRVRPEADGEFRDRYGADGSWVKLFRRGSGHIATHLYRDRDQPDRYVTVDVWESDDAFRQFRSEFAAEYEELDQRCALLTVAEERLGEFDEH